MIYSSKKLIISICYIRKAVHIPFLSALLSFNTKKFFILKIPEAALQLRNLSLIYLIKISQIIIVIKIQSYVSQNSKSKKQDQPHIQHPHAETEKTSGTPPRLSDQDTNTNPAANQYQIHKNRIAFQ